jgi:putative flippase GtrA
VNLESQRSFPQFVRYLLVGGFNTIFGYGLFALLNWSFAGLGSYSYLYAWLLTSLIALTAAFLGYKWLVFDTQGNYFVEWIRCLGVYSGSMAFGFFGMAILVPVLRTHLQKPNRASYIAAAILAVFNAIFSFIGHKKFSFRTNPNATDPKVKMPDV